MIETLTGAEAVLSAAHTGPDGRLHGHTWTVKAWWAGEPCVVEMQGKIRDWLSKFDHGVLPPNMGRGEAIATQAMMALGCEEVEVSRSAEGLFSKVRMKR